MAKRHSPPVTGEIYHVFNRSVALQPIIKSVRDYNHMLEILQYYQFKDPPIRLSQFRNKLDEIKKEILNRLHKKGKLVEIYAFCLMPNHFHLLLKQLTDDGISNYLRLIQNSYAKYLNIKSKRFGAVFQAGYKTVRIENDNQLIHVLRYIHINPLTSYVLDDKKGIYTYPYTSFIDYTSNEPRDFVDINFASKYFSSKKKFIEFHLNQVDYQRSLDQIKHLLLE